MYFRWHKHGKINSAVSCSKHPFCAKRTNPKETKLGPAWREKEGVAREGHRRTYLCRGISHRLYHRHTLEYTPSSLFMWAGVPKSDSTDVLLCHMSILCLGTHRREQKATVNYLNIIKTWFWSGVLPQDLVLWNQLVGNSLPMDWCLSIKSAVNKKHPVCVQHHCFQLFSLAQSSPAGRLLRQKDIACVGLCAYWMLCFLARTAEEQSSPTEFWQYPARCLHVLVWGGVKWPGRSGCTYSLSK